MNQKYLYFVGTALVAAVTWSWLVADKAPGGPGAVAPGRRELVDRGSSGGEIKRLARAVSAIQDEQDALNEDMDELAQVMDEEHQAPSPRGGSQQATTDALRAHEEVIARALERQPRDNAMESTLVQALSMHDGDGPLDLLSLSCYSSACRLELGGGSSESPISVLMSTPSLGGELLAMPDPAHPDLLVVHVARDHGALPGGV